MQVTAWKTTSSGAAYGGNNLHVGWLQWVFQRGVFTMFRRAPECSALIMRGTTQQLRSLYVLILSPYKNTFYHLLHWDCSKKLILLKSNFTSLHSDETKVSWNYLKLFRECWEGCLIIYFSCQTACFLHLNSFSIARTDQTKVCWLADRALYDHHTWYCLKHVSVFNSLQPLNYDLWSFMKEEWMHGRDTVGEILYIYINYFHLWHRCHLGKWEKLAVGGLKPYYRCTLLYPA